MGRSRSRGGYLGKKASLPESAAYLAKLEKHLAESRPQKISLGLGFDGKQLFDSALCRALGMARFDPQHIKKRRQFLTTMHST